MDWLTPYELVWEGNRLVRRPATPVWMEALIEDIRNSEKEKETKEKGANANE